MTNKQIYELTAQTTPTATDVVAIDQAADNVTKKVQIQNLPKAFNVTAPVTNTGGTIAVSAASTTAAGVVEISIASEVNTGTDAARAVSPDALAGSYAGSKNVQLTIADPATTPSATGDGKVQVIVPAVLNGMDLVAAHAVVTTVSSSGTPTFAIRRERSGSAVDMLSTNITIDANEKTSYTAATAPVINTSNDDVATGDIIYVDLDTVGTGAKGHAVVLTFRLP